MPDSVMRTASAPDSATDRRTTPFHTTPLVKPNPCPYLHGREKLPRFYLSGEANLGLWGITDLLL